MNNAKPLQIANIIGFILVILLNTLAVTLPIAGRNTGEISDLYPNLFVPAGYAFSIWSVIYLLLLIFVVKQAKGLFSTDPAPGYVHTIGWWFFISCLANSSWILAWHHLQVLLSVGIMLVILISLIIIYLKLEINYVSSPVPLLVRLPFSVYLGWITVATVANVTAFLVSIGWDGFGLSESIWTVLMLCTATFIGLFVLWPKSDFAYIAVILWAFIAILVNQQRKGAMGGEHIITPVYLFIGFILASTVVRIILTRKHIEL